MRIISAVAKTGRTLDLIDLTGRTAGRRRRARIGRWIGVVVSAAIALLTVVYTVEGAVSLISAQGEQSAYDKAPYCSGQTAQTPLQSQSPTQNCVLRTTAEVGYVYASKNTGKGAHGYTTKADLDPTSGQSQTVTLSSTRNLTGSVEEGDLMPVLVWRDQITRFTFQGKTHDADQNPHHIVADDLAQVTLCLIAACLFGRPLIRKALRSRIAVNLRRNRIPDWTLLFLALTTAFAAILRASYVVAALGLAGVAVLVLSAVWPFVPWVATYSERGRSVLGSRADARAARKRNRPRPGRLP